MCPNYKVFQLLTNVSVPEAVSTGLLLVLEGGGYRLQQCQDPFRLDPALYNPESWRIQAQWLGRADGALSAKSIACPSLCVRFVTNARFRANPYYELAHP